MAGWQLLLLGYFLGAPLGFLLQGGSGHWAGHKAEIGKAVKAVSITDL